MIECHCGKCDRLATKNTKLKERVAELEATILEMCEHFDLPNVEDFIGGVTGVPKFRYMYLKTEKQKSDG